MRTMEIMYLWKNVVVVELIAAEIEGASDAIVRLGQAEEGVHEKGLGPLRALRRGHDAGDESGVMRISRSGRGTLCEHGKEGPDCGLAPPPESTADPILSNMFAKERERERERETGQ